LGYFGTRDKVAFFPKHGAGRVVAQGGMLETQSHTLCTRQLLAIWYVTQWLAQGAPRRVRVVEVGPGRGVDRGDGRAGMLGQRGEGLQGYPGMFVVVSGDMG
jgi:hypothetical protein